MAVKSVTVKEFNRSKESDIQAKINSWEWDVGREWGREWTSKAVMHHNFHVSFFNIVGHNF